MSTPAVSDRDLVYLLAALLADANVGVWRPTGPDYTTGETGIWYGALDTTPDRGLAVALYATSDTLGHAPVHHRYVQVRVRGAKGDITDADTLAGAVFDTLNGVTHTGPIAQVRRTSVIRLGADDSDRQERCDNYEVLLN